MHPCTVVIETKRQRCNQCANCLAKDCGQCVFCKDKVKFGGQGRKKQCCIQRRCLQLNVEGTACIDLSAKYC